jgi:hypothetical protein
MPGGRVNGSNPFQPCNGLPQANTLEVTATKGALIRMIGIFKISVPNSNLEKHLSRGLQMENGVL